VTSAVVKTGAEVCFYNNVVQYLVRSVKGRGGPFYYGEWQMAVIVTHFCFAVRDLTHMCVVFL